MHALERVSGCPRIVRVLSTNSRTGRPPCLGVDRARVLDVRIFVKISEPGDPDPISFLTKILTSKTRARAPVRTEGALSAACPRHVHKLADWAPPFSGGGECSRFGCKDFRQNLKAGRSRSYLIFDENPYIQNASAVRCPDEGGPLSTKLWTDHGQFPKPHTHTPPKRSGAKREAWGREEGELKKGTTRANSANPTQS
jgi:hypothetical protein